MRSNRTMMLAGVIGTMALASGIEAGQIIRVADEPIARKKVAPVESGPAPEPIPAGGGKRERERRLRQMSKQQS